MLTPPAFRGEDMAARIRWGVAAAIMLAVFLAQLALTLKLNQHDDLTMINRFFDADNAWYLVNFETGNQTFGSYGGRNFVHPNVANFVHPLVLIVSQLVHIHARDVSLAVAPAFAGLRSGLLFAVFTTAGFGLADALLATALGSLAFSSVLFGCLPESFVMSGAFFALFFLLIIKAASGRAVPWWSWVMTGLLLSSTTITNLAPFAIGLLLLLILQTKDVSRSAKRALSVSAAALVGTICCFLILTAAHGTFRGIGARRIGQLEEVRFSPRSLFLQFPMAMVRGMVADRPNQMTGTDEEHKSNQVQLVRFTYRDDLDLIKQYVATITSYQQFSSNGPVEIAALSLLALAVLFSARVIWAGAPAIKILYVVSLSQLLFHWILHSFFGLELFLYSQHWMVPLLIAVCCGFTFPRAYG